MNKGECRWVSVEERLPEEMGFCLVFVDEVEDMGTRMDVAFYAIRDYGSMAVEKTGWGRFALYNSGGGNITHWMPFPAPPDPPKKKVKKEGWVLPSSLIKDHKEFLGENPFCDCIKVTYEVEE